MPNASINVRFANGRFSSERSAVVSLITSRLNPPVPYGRSNAWRLQLQDGRPAMSDKQMLMLFKPETLAAGTDAAGIVDRAFECLNDHGYEIEGVSLLSGPFLARNGIMERHYGQINRVYREGSEALSSDALDKIEALFGVRPQSCDIIGGEYFMKFFGMKPSEMNDLWVQAQGFGKVKKLAPGVYCTPYSTGRFMSKYLLNGFHAMQLANFCAPGRITAAVSVRSGDNASSWNVMRQDFAGATDPAKANAGSMRSWLLANKRALGMATVDTQLNGIHLSAGPVESMAEISNWFPWVTSGNTIMGRLLEGVLAPQKIDGLTANPTVNYAGKSAPVFDLTENMEPEEAIEVIRAIK